MRGALAVLAVAVAGCATPQQRMQQRMIEAESVCSAAGFQQGSPEYQQCTIQMYQAAAANRQAQSAAAIAAGAAMIQASQPKPPPPPVTCRWFANSWICN